jgi:hypothetical protein
MYLIMKYCSSHYSLILLEKFQILEYVINFYISFFWKKKKLQKIIIN